MADENKTERVQLLMTPSELNAIDEWSFENRIRGRAEAIRRLCQIGIGLDDNLRQLLVSYDKTGKAIVPMVRSLTEAVKTKNAEHYNEFFDKLATFIEDIASHREHIAELGHTTGTLKTIDWRMNPSFTDALDVVRKVRAERRGSSNIVLLSEKENQEIAEPKPADGQ